MAKLYTYQAVDRLIEKYINLEGDATQIREGVLGSGDWILQAHGKKSAVIKEVYVNAWNSAHTITFYNKLPKKYEKILENI